MPALPLLVLPLLVAPLALRAETCDALLAQIDAKIRAGGATSFTLTTVDADAVVTGRVIGSCGMGRKKILYTSLGGSYHSAMPAGATMGNPSGSARARTTPAVLTECKAGYTGADCRRRQPSPPSAIDPAKPAP